MESRRNRRRIPEEQRKRTQLSCDLCRKRRCKCVRQKDEPCLTCQQSQVECISTFRRKTRLYGSFETIRDRYRCLEAIVKGAFPTEPIRTVDDLLALGNRHGFSMPEVSTSSDQQLLTPSTDRGLSGLSQQRDFSSDEDQDPSLSAADANREPAQTYGRQIGQIQDSPRLVRDSSGRPHYIGPSGSLTFFAELRDLVSERQPSSRFAADNVAEALEARSDTYNSPRPGIDETNQFYGVAAGPSPATTSTPSDLLRSAWRFRELPPHIVERLLHLYFERVHPDFPLLHRTIFQDEFERYLTFGRDRSRSRIVPQTVEGSEADEGWLVCLHMMLAFGCVLLTRLGGNESNRGHFDYETLRTECWSLARAALPRLTTTCTQSNVQALLLLALYYHSNNERNASWTLVGCAARIAIAIGLHRNDVNGSFRSLERETRKRVWCTFYSFEQFLCMSLGRPSAIDDQEVNVSVPSDDMMGSGYGPPGCTERSFELQLLSSRLRQMMSVQYQPAHRRRTLRPAAVHKPSPKALLDELRAWEDAMPAHLLLPEFNTPEGSAIPSPLQLRELYSRYPAHHLRATILLHVQYHNLVILLTRPYLLMVIFSSSRDPAGTAYPWEDASGNATRSEDNIAFLARTCVSSASRIATLILLLDSAGVLNGLTWLDVFYAYSAAMVLLLRILWISNPSSPQDVVETEERLRSHTQSLVIELRRVLRSLPKCFTMDRFASVVENFAETVTSSTAGSRAQRSDEGADTSRPRPTQSSVPERDTARHSLPAAPVGVRRTHRDAFGTVHTGEQTSSRRRTVSRPSFETASNPMDRSHGSSNLSALETLAEASHSIEATTNASNNGASNDVIYRAVHPSPRHAYEGVSRDRVLATPNSGTLDIDNSTSRTRQSPYTKYNSTIIQPSGSYSNGPPPYQGMSLSYPSIPNPNTQAYLPENTNMMAPFAEEGLSPGSLLWQDPLQAVTQHMLDWNDFERFLGSFDFG